VRKASRCKALISRAWEIAIRISARMIRICEIPNRICEFPDGFRRDLTVLYELFTHSLHPLYFHRRSLFLVIRQLLTQGWSLKTGGAVCGLCGGIGAGLLGS